MRISRMLVLLAVAVVMVGLASCSGTREAPLGNTGGTDLGDFTIADPITINGLTIYPVLSKTPQNKNPYLTLDEGVEKKLIEVGEKGSGEAPQANTREENGQGDINWQSNRNISSGGSASVNELYIQNNSDRPLYLMAGEIVIGGKQDRTVASDMIIPPNSKPIPLSVFCVEHGRWSQRKANDSAAFALASGNMEVAKRVKKLKKGEFTSSVQTIDNGTRRRMQQKQEQQEVWDAVAFQNTKNASAGKDASYLNNMADKKVKLSIDPIIKKLELSISNRENIVGVISVVNGKIQSVDIFNNTPLFRKLWPKLLRAYSLDVVNVKLDKNAKAPTAAEVNGLLMTINKSTVTNKKMVQKAQVLSSENDELMIFGCYMDGEKTKTKDWSNSFVHRNIYVKK